MKQSEKFSPETTRNEKNIFYDEKNTNQTLCFIADLMVKGGVKAIWSFANVQLTVPDEVAVQREVIAGGLAELSVKLRKSGDGEAAKE